MEEQTTAKGDAVRSAMMRIGFREDTSLAIVEEHGINTTERLMALSERDVENLYTVLQQEAWSRTPGVFISFSAKQYLAMAAYHLRHQKRISRTVDIADVTIKNVIEIRRLMLKEGRYTDEKEVKFRGWDPEDWPTNICALFYYLMEHLGVTGIPLAYVVRDTHAPGADPIGGGKHFHGHPGEEWEMVARAPHMDAEGEPLAVYLVDRQKVWELIADLCDQEDQYWKIIKPARLARDGRAAFRALHVRFTCFSSKP